MLTIIDFIFEDTILKPARILVTGWSLELDCYITSSRKASLVHLYQPRDVEILKKHKDEEAASNYHFKTITEFRRKKNAS